MDEGKELVTRFYSAFQQLDSVVMNSCYAQDIVFFDPMFEMLNGDEVRYMWDMLCDKATDFKLQFEDVENIGDGYYTCKWEATYAFGKNKRTVVNNVKANMRLTDGKIVEHSDGFSLHEWSKQAIGFSGWLLGWNSMFRRKIKNTAKKNLLAYMQNVNA